MRTYHLFQIKEEFYHAYHKNPDSLYRTLQNLYEGDITNISLATSLYRQICELHNIDVLSAYLNGIAYRREKNKYLLVKRKVGEKTLVYIRPSVIEIKSNKNVPHIFKALSYYSSHLFVCDFKNRDYFWL